MKKTLNRKDMRPEDIGRMVIYNPMPAHLEEGVITSFNEHVVFVRYGSSYGSKATSYEDLRWSFPGGVQPTDRNA